jgi:hypothetical protein
VAWADEEVCTWSILKSNCEMYEVGEGRGG